MGDLLDILKKGFNNKDFHPAKADIWIANGKLGLIEIKDIVIDHDGDVILTLKEE